MTLAAIGITVYGHPAQQGSKRHVGNGVMVEASKRLRPWRDAVKHEALDVMKFHDRLNGPVRVDLTFAYDRPTGHWRIGRNAHRLRESAPGRPANRSSGDIDKSARAILDALTDAGVIVDDAQVCDLRARKVWTGVEEDTLHIPGVRIEVLEVAR